MELYCMPFGEDYCSLNIKFFIKKILMSHNNKAGIPITQLLNITTLKL